MTTFRRFFRFLGPLLLLTVVLTACADQPERFWLKSPGWSRAQLMDNTRVGDTVPITLDDAGRIYLFVISASNDVSQLRVVALDRQVDIAWDRTYEEIELTRPAKPHILWDGEVLQLFWLSGQGLYNTQVDVTGRLLAPPNLLSGETMVSHYNVARNASGTIAAWYAGTRDVPGVYALPPGNLTGEATLVDAAGVRPDLQYDDAGTLHVTWAHHPPGSGDKPFFYAAYPDGYYRPGQERVIATPRAVGTTALEGPQLGLDGQYAYVFWTLIFYSGLEAGTARAEYVYFPKGQPSSASSAHQWGVPYSYDLPYQAFREGDLKAGARVPMGSEFRGGATYITDLTTNHASEQELVITFHARLAYLMRKQQSQVGAGFFQDGVLTGYQLLSFTPSRSTYPAIFSDEAGQLYLTWLEKGALPGWVVYFASTAPDIREALDNVTSDDVGRLSAETLFGILTGIVLIPFAVVWIAPSLIVLALTGRLRGAEERLTGSGTIVSLALALITLWGIKMTIFPGMFEYVPLSAWLPIIPSWLKPLLQLGVPLLIAGLAFLAARYYTGRKEVYSVFLFMIIYTVVDAILTMAVYGVLVYAAF